tara:strand:+ start:805 stop:1053 length:249 start_codon:yes stop_codon:yes gene_type:complete
VTFSGEKKADSKLPRVTKWIQDDKGQALPETSASLWLQHYGEKAYFVYDSSMQSFTLINQEEFDTMTAEQQSYLNAPVHASV